MKDTQTTPTKMHRFETIDLGERDGDAYFLVGLVEPEPTACEDFNPDRDASSFGVRLERVSDEGAVTEVVRVENIQGERPYWTLTYLDLDADDHPTERLSEGFTYEKMKQYLCSHWADFADGLTIYDDE